MKRTLLILTFLSLVLIACTKEEVANHKLSLDKLFVTATANGGVEEITVTTTGEWKASITGHVDWVRIKNVNFGTGDGVIAIEFSENNGEYRTAELVVSLADGTKPRTVSLNQETEKGTPVVSIVQPEEIFPFTAGEYKVSYYSNIVADDLQISCEASWLKSPSLDGSYITFTLEENEDPKKRRTTQLWLTYIDEDSNEYKAVCTISQAPKVDNSKFDAESSNDSYEIDEEGFKF